jgi:hypothetical protein
VIQALFDFRSQFPVKALGARFCSLAQNIMNGLPGRKVNLWEMGSPELQFDFAALSDLVTAAKNLLFTSVQFFQFSWRTEQAAQWSKIFRELLDGDVGADGLHRCQQAGLFRVEVS